MQQYASLGEYLQIARWGLTCIYDLNVRNQASRHHLNVFPIGDDISAQLSASGGHLAIANPNQKSRHDSEENGSNSDNSVLMALDKSVGASVSQTAHDEEGGRIFFLLLALSFGLIIGLAFLI